MYKNTRYLLFSLIDPQEKHEFGQKHGCRCVWVDAPGVGLEASQAGQHQDSEDESQHGQAQSAVGDQAQGLQIPVQLLLTEKNSVRPGFWIYGPALWQTTNLSMWAVHQHAKGPQSLTLTADMRGVPVHDHTVPDRPASSQIIPADKDNEEWKDSKLILSSWVEVSSCNKWCGCWSASNR